MPGKQIHDANLVAIALVHGVPVIATQNTSDFTRSDGQVEVRSLT